ncbi:hypothetical protein ADIS_1290 [Lunatimonas lonarensis]|uniref:DUF1330 domain-containing protein n=1 Tax=Lunatimonas lonarensis TaxID=1232681 RepID=R7ZVQ9_9BACT|nr:DUF1330 domain-containing protein [Lunatimonas lonarensis]EON78093.1 hypothetical protein ADIS_1290 [Lunatimonas lonarensis]
MAAYVIVEVSIHDTEKYEAYKRLTPASLAPFKGRFLVRGGKTETLEGDWNPERVIVLEFPTSEQARGWWHSDAYGIARKIRQEAAHTQMLLLEGL